MNDSINKVKVSIICNTYNHAKYIRDALDGFVMQKTDFLFEVLIHDDASTDGTADIIREYEAKYPDLIKPIYQTENQYSKGIGAPSIFQRPRVTGKYIAFCEGDDYWTDPLKLQKQYDAMEAHPEVDMCAHAAIKVNAETKQKIADIKPKKENSVISVDEVIYGEGGYVATNSLFYRANLYQNEPEFRKILKLDYTLQIHGALRGGMLYLADCMAAYRYMAEGSWTIRMRANTQKSEEFYQKKQTMLTVLNNNTQFKYNDIIQRRMLKNEAAHCLELGNFKQFLSKKYKTVFREFPIKMRIKIRLKAAFPFVLKIKKALRGRQA